MGCSSAGSKSGVSGVGAGVGSSVGAGVGSGVAGVSVAAGASVGTGVSGAGWDSGFWPQPVSRAASISSASSRESVFSISFSFGSVLPGRQKGSPARELIMTL